MLTHLKTRRWQLGILAAMVIAASVVSQDAKKPESNRSTAPKNLGFEEGELGQVPPSWFIPPVCTKDGYELKVSEDKPFAGKRCAVLGRSLKSNPSAFGNVIQSVDASSYRGKRVRFKAAVRADVSQGGHAQLWFRVDRPGNDMGFFDNMDDRPIKTNEWKHYEIVGDIADDAQAIVFGMMLIGNGQVAIDDVSFDVVDKSIKLTGKADPLKSPAPGITDLGMATTVTAVGNTKSVSFLYPLPLAYRDQMPMSFHLTVDPPEAGKSVEVIESVGPNRLLKLTLHELDKHRKVNVAYRSLVLVGPTKFDHVPKSAAFPKDWPAEAQPWLASTWCCEWENERIKKMAEEIRGDSKDVLAVIRATLDRARTVFADAEGHVTNLTAIEALDKKGSCTSCANLVAALLRGAGIPARVLAGYPLWSGPLQTHYIVEAYVPGYGWYPVESTQCQAPWPNYQQVNVCIVPIEHESKTKAGRRRSIAGAVPYLSLTESEDETVSVISIGTLKQYCDHECRMIRPIKASDAEWMETFAWAKPRWETWLKSNPKIENGKLQFGLRADEVKANTLESLRAELR